MATSYDPKRERDSTPIRQKLRAAAVGSSHMVWIVEPSGMVWFLNRAWSAFTGLPEHELNSGGLAKVIHPDDALAISNAFLEASANSLPFHLEYRVHRQGDGYEWLLSTGHPFFKSDGSLGGYTGSCMARRAVLQARNDPDHKLTLREREALSWVSQGLTSVQIAEKMGIGSRTVESHLTSAADKFGADNRTSAVVEGIRRGEIPI